MADKLRINGNQYDFGSTLLKIADEPFYGVTSITWSEKRERQKAWGAGKSRRPRGRNRGRYVPGELKMTMWRDSWHELQKLAASLAADGVSYGNAEFPVVLQYVEDESNQDPQTHEFEDVCIIGPDESTEDEAGPDKVDVIFDFMSKKTNGLTLYDSSGEA